MKEIISTAWNAENKDFGSYLIVLSPQGVLGAIGPENMWLLTYFVISLKAKILEVCNAQEEKRPRRKDALVPHQP